MKSTTGIIWTYRAVWLAAALIPWLTMTALYVGNVGETLTDPGPGRIEVLHDVSLVSPFLGWLAARRAVRGSRERAWALSGPAPLWAIWTCVGYVAIALLGFGLMRVPVYGVAGLYLPLLVGRLGVNLWWLAECARDASRIGVIERAKPDADDRAFVFHRINDSRAVSVAHIDNVTLRLHAEGGLSLGTWALIDPLVDGAPLCARSVQ